MSVIVVPYVMATKISEGVHELQINVGKAMARIVTKIPIIPAFLKS